MQKQYLSSILAALAGLSTSFAAISVTPTGSAVLQFDTQPVVADWSTLTGVGGPDDVFDAASLDAAVQTHAAADVTTSLGSSAQHECGRTAKHKPPSSSEPPQWRHFLYPADGDVAE